MPKGYRVRAASTPSKDGVVSNGELKGLKLKKPNSKSKFRISDFVLRIYLLYSVFSVIPTARITPIAQY